MWIPFLSLTFINLVTSEEMNLPTLQTKKDLFTPFMVRIVIVYNYWWLKSCTNDLKSTPCLLPCTCLLLPCQSLRLSFTPHFRGSDNCKSPTSPQIPCITHDPVTVVFSVLLFVKGLFTFHLNSFTPQYRNSYYKLTNIIFWGFTVTEIFSI